MSDDKKKDMFSIPRTKMEALREGQERIDDLKKKYKKKNNLKIQALEEYFKEIGLSEAQRISKIATDYSELSTDKSYPQNDILSITPGIESPPASRLYAALLVVKYQQQMKETKKLLLDPYYISDAEKEIV